jgi:hypothetical protein
LPCCTSSRDSICHDCFRMCLNTAISDGKVRKFAAMVNVTRFCYLFTLIGV